MADKPILFSAPMVRALLDGTKTQTRRVLKPQPFIRPEINETSGFFEIYNGDEVASRLKMRIRLGDRLWVKEAHYLTDDGHNTFAVYSEDQQSVYEHLAAIDSMQADLRLSDSWAKPHRKQRPMIFMPRWASRLTLIVTDVRVERLQDISEEDAAAEGVPSDDNYAGSFAKEYCHRCGGSGLHGAFGQNYGVIEVDCAECETSKLRYRNLWNHINGPGAWEANPWVVAYTFTVMRGNIDQIGGE